MLEEQASHRQHALTVCFFCATPLLLPKNRIRFSTAGAVCPHSSAALPHHRAVSSNVLVENNSRGKCKRGRADVTNIIPERSHTHTP